MQADECRNAGALTGPGRCRFRAEQPPKLAECVQAGPETGRIDCEALDSTVRAGIKEDVAVAQCHAVHSTVLLKLPSRNPVRPVIDVHLFGIVFPINQAGCSASSCEWMDETYYSATNYPDTKFFLNPTTTAKTAAACYGKTISDDLTNAANDTDNLQPLSSAVSSIY